MYQKWFKMDSKLIKVPDTRPGLHQHQRVGEEVRLTKKQKNLREQKVRRIFSVLSVIVFLNTYLREVTYYETNGYSQQDRG